MDYFSKLKNDLEIMFKKVNLVLLEENLFEKELISDVDILIKKSDFSKLKIILKKLGYDYNFKYYDTVFFHKIYKGNIIRLHFHFNKMFSFIILKKLTKYDFQIIKNSSIKYLSKELFLVSNILKFKIGRSRKKYLNRIKKNIKLADTDLFLEKLNLICYNIKLNKSLNDKNINLFLKKLKFKKTFLFKYYRDNLYKKLRLINFVIYKFFYPSDFIALIGTDGSGKTTTIKNVVTKLKNHKFSVYLDYGGRFNFRYLFFLNYFAKKVANHKKKLGSNENIIKYNSNLIQFIIPIIYFIEYLLRYIFGTFWKRRLYNYVIMDRYFIDILISPNTNKFISKILYFIIPKPNKVIFLYNDYKVLIKRRPEHPAWDIKRQLKEFKKNDSLFYGKIKTKNEKQTLDDLLKLIFSK